MKVLLVDDHALMREGLALLFEERFPGVELVSASDLALAKAALADHGDIELVVLDLGLPDVNGFDGLRTLRKSAREIPIVLMSGDDRPETILSAMDHGASGFIPKTSRGGAIEQALRIVLDGGIYLPPELRRSVAQAPAVGSRVSAVELQEMLVESLGLSPRQVDVLRLLVLGHSTKAISRELGVAESTIKTHLIGLFRKLDVNSRTQAIITATRLGFRFDE